MFGPFYTTGDVIGCGINFHTHQIFYTKNGKLIGARFVAASPGVVSLQSRCECPQDWFVLIVVFAGVAFSDVNRRLLPTVSLHSPGETVKFNFGAEPFQFDLAAYTNVRI